jgi:transposase
MPDNEEKQEIKEKIKELQEFVSNSRDVREWKRGEAVRLRVLGVSYQEIQKRLGVSISFIAKSQKKYTLRGIAGLKLGYQGSKSYLTDEEKSQIIEWLRPRERRNISELERHLIETYDVVFKSPESYYHILRESQLSWQKGNRGNPRKNQEKVEEKIKKSPRCSRNLRGI